MVYKGNIMNKFFIIILLALISIILFIKIEGKESSNDVNDCNEKFLFEKVVV